MWRIVSLTICAVLISCATRVERIDVESQMDLSGQWNDTDSRLVAEEMIQDALSRVWLTNFYTEQEREPVVIVGTIRNLTTEHIAIGTFVTDVERELINSGMVRFVAAKGIRDEIRDERLDHQQYACEETAKRLAAELGADFMLQGAIRTIEDAVPGRKVIFYQTDLELVNMETNEKVWIGSKEIKKYIERPRHGW